MKLLFKSMTLRSKEKPHRRPAELLTRENNHRDKPRTPAGIFPARNGVRALGWPFMGTGQGLARPANVYRGPVTCKTPSWGLALLPRCPAHAGTLLSGGQGRASGRTSIPDSLAPIGVPLPFALGFITWLCVYVCLLVRRCTEITHPVHQADARTFKQILV